MVINHSLPEIKDASPNVGDKRTVSFFAFLPIRIGDQSRWLENVVIDQKYGCGKEPVCVHYDWQNLKFVDKGV